MNEYIARLRVVGFKPTDAVKIYEGFMRFHDLKCLNEFIDELEQEHVEEI